MAARDLFIGGIVAQIAIPWRTAIHGRPRGPQAAGKSEGRGMKLRMPRGTSGEVVIGVVGNRSVVNEARSRATIASSTGSASNVSSTDIERRIARAGSHVFRAAAMTASSMAIERGIVQTGDRMDARRGDEKEGGKEEEESNGANSTKRSTDWKHS